MSNSMSKIFSIVQIVLLLLSALAFALYFFSGSISEDLFIGWSYVLLGIALVSAVLFSVVNVFMNFKSAIKSVLGIVILIVIVGIAYLLASDHVFSWQGMDKLNFEVTGELMKNTGTGIITMYLLLGIAVVAAVFSEIIKIFK